MIIEKSGRDKHGAFFIRAGQHRWTWRRGKSIYAMYHGALQKLEHAERRSCCVEFERAAEFERSGLELLDQTMTDLEE